MPEAVASSTGPGRTGPREASTRIPYRADIDGLRAIAVVLVVAYHFGVPGFSGGYIGVDLFFAISGYLIASIFQRRTPITWTGLAAFYGRRIQRLMPAFLFVAAVTIAVGTVLLLPDDYGALLKSVRESLLARSNVYFAHETTGYFAANAAQLPWLHTWSLSVEWQFYLAFPVVVFALRRLPSVRVRTIASWSIAIVAILWSVRSVATDPAAAYFASTARFFEFFLGALAASVALPASIVRHARILSAVGVIALLLLANHYTTATAFPGFAALAVCAIGFVLLAAGAHGSILADTRLAAIGKRSYSIYLWHWPVVAMLAYVQHVPSGFEVAVWFGVVFVAADATWRWIEVPGVALAWRPRKAFVVGCVLPLAGLAVAVAFVRHHDGFPQRLGAEAAHADANVRRYETHAFDRCHDPAASDVEACASGDAGASTRVLLIGDSHARHFRPFLTVLADDAHVRLQGVTNSECLVLDGTGMSPERALQAACVEAVVRDMALVRGGRYRYVVLAQRWIGYPAEALAGLDRTLDGIVAAGAVPIVFLAIAEDGTRPKDCFDRHIKFREPYANDCAIRQDNPFAARHKADVAALMATMAGRHPSLVVIDPQAVQCAAGSCVTVLDATSIYDDLHHINAFGSTMLGRAWLARFGNPLKGDGADATRR